LAAGFIDAVAGGGLVQLPALLRAFPAQLPAILFGTNKLAAAWSTLTAAARYAPRVRLDASLRIPALAMALVGVWSRARCCPWRCCVRWPCCWLAGGRGSHLRISGARRMPRAASAGGARA
jgi:hypothetical protein